MDYSLDPNAAKAADNINARIEASGKYLGIITRAEQVTSKKGTKGVDLSFKADTGKTSDYLTIWTHNGEGKQLQGFNALMALMTCVSVRELKAENGEVEKYDQATQKRIKVIVPLFKDLMNKPVGFLLQMEEYARAAGGTAWKPTIFGVFNKDEFTASEILARATQAGKLPKMLDALKDKPLKAGSAQNTPSSASTHAQNSTPADFNDFDTEIPF